MDGLAYRYVSASDLSRDLNCASYGAGLDARATHFEQASSNVDERARRSKLVRAVQRSRRVRDAFFDPLLFADPAWDMLLELYGSYLEQRRISVSSLCIASHVPATTALRWITKLEQDELAVRKDDPNDGRRSWIELTDDGIDRMNQYFDMQSAGCPSI